MPKAEAFQRFFSFFAAKVRFNKCARGLNTVNPLVVRSHNRRVTFDHAISCYNLHVMLRKRFQLTERWQRVSAAFLGARL